MTNLGRQGVAGAWRLALCAGFALAWVCGCSDSELVKKEDENRGLTERWQKSEAARAALTTEKARLTELLKERESTLASAKQAYEAANDALKKRTTEAAERAAALKRVEEKSYDLEMSYETLSTRIKELKNEIDERNASIGKSKKVITELGEQMRVNEENFKKSLAEQTGKTEEARGETAKMRALAESLDAEGQKLKAKNLQLEKEAAQIPDLKAQIGSLAGAKENLEARVAKADKDVQGLERQVTSIQAAAKAAGTDLTVGVATLSDWEVVKRVGADRWQRALEGKFAGDEVDWAIVGVAGTLLFLFVAWIGASVSAIRRGRRVRRLQAEAAATSFDPMDISPTDEDLELPAVEHGTADAEESFNAPRGASATRQAARSVEARVAGEWESESGAEEQPNVTEMMEPALAGGDADEEVGRTQMIAPPRAHVAQRNAVTPRRAQPQAPAKPAKDDALIGELRDVINKKFDELLK